MVLVYKYDEDKFHLEIDARDYENKRLLNALTLLPINLI